METQFDETTDASTHLPRLGILHFLSWMFCTAVYLTISSRLHRHQQYLAEFTNDLQFFMLFQSLAGGAAVTGAIVLIHARFRAGPPLLLPHPGHWLLLTSGSLSFFFLILYLAIDTLTGILRVNDSQLLLYGFMQISFAVALMFAVLETQSLRWKIWIAAVVAVALLLGSGYFLSVCHWPRLNLVMMGWRLVSTLTLVEYGLCIWLLVLGTIDLAVGQRRDWLHWTGVGAYLGSQCGNLIWSIGLWLHS